MKKNNIGMSMGSPTLLFIFVILSLVSFSILTLSSALTDKKYTDKIVDKNTCYYEACNKAEDKLSQIDTYLSELYKSGISKHDYYAKVNDGASFAIAVSEYQSLQIDVLFLYPVKEGECFDHITKWCLVNVNVPQPDDFLPVLQ